MKKITALSLGVLLFANLLFFGKFIFTDHLPFATGAVSSDLLDFNFPERMLYADFLKENKIPLWTRYQANGFPIAAQSETGVFFPINVALFKFLPPVLAFNLSLSLAYLILAIGTYCFVRVLGGGRTAGLFAGLVMPFTGFFMSHLQNIQMVQAASFLPWGLIGIHKLLESSNKKYIVLIASSFCLAILAGHLSTAYSVIFFSCLYFILRVWELKRGKKPVNKILFMFFAGCVLALGLSAIQLALTLEMIPHSTRSLPFGDFNQNFPLSHLVSFFSPFWFGDPSRGTYRFSDFVFWEYTGYVGIATLILGVGGLLFIKEKKLRAFKILTMLSLVIILVVPISFLQYVWKLFLGFGFFRLPSRFLLFVNFFIVVLAAFALERLIISRVKKRSVAISLTALITIIGVADPFFYFYGFYNKIPAQAWLKKPETVSYLSQEPATFRIETVQEAALHEIIYNKSNGWRNDLSYYIFERELLAHSTNVLFGVRSIHFPNEYTGSFALRRESKLASVGEEENITLPYASKILGLQNVKYVLSWNIGLKEDLKGFYLKKVIIPQEKGALFPIAIYENTDFLPVGYMVHTAKVVRKRKIIPYMTSEDFNHKKEVVLEEEVPLPSLPSVEGEDKVIPVNSSAQYVSFNVFATEPSYFVLAHTYYPGWVAKVDGIEVPIYRANYAFRAITLAPGNHKVEFIYQPLSFKIGVTLTLFSIGVAVVLLGDPFKKKAHKRSNRQV